MRAARDVAAAITGVAGPEPDEDGNSVGKVCLAVARAVAHARSRANMIPAQVCFGERRNAVLGSVLNKDFSAC